MIYNYSILCIEFSFYTAFFFNCLLHFYIEYQNIEYQNIFCSVGLMRAALQRASWA